MILERLSIDGFRNLSDLVLNMNPDTNIIFGKNGHGKTSVLDAIYFLSIGKSFKTSTDKVLKNYYNNFFEAQGNYISQHNFQIERRIYYSENDGKHLFSDNIELEKTSDFIGIVPVVLLTLDDTNIMFNGPEYRRKFMDIILSQTNVGYLQSLQKYNKVLSQRTALLSEIREKREAKSVLSIWDDQLVQYNEELVVHRINFINFLSERIDTTYSQIAGKKEAVGLTYKSGCTNDHTMDLNKISDFFKTHLSNNQEVDIQRQLTSLGCHRDDLLFKKDNNLFKQYASQGENKSFLISLKKIESEYIELMKKEKPIILFDDIFSELDDDRITGSINLIRESGQVIITTTSVSLLDKYTDVSFFEIVNGEITNATN